MPTMLEVTSAIAEAAVAVTLIGTAVLLVLAAAALFRWIERAL